MTVLPTRWLPSFVLLGCLAAATCAAAPSASAPRLRADPVESAHVRAVDLFRHGRFAEAYGRFIEGAEAGHPASARYAIWMCENGPELFGAAWDCAPYELEDWRVTATTPARAVATRLRTR